MHRFLPLLFVALSVTHCQNPSQCNSVRESAVDINAHLALTPDALSGAKLTFCRNGSCASADLGTVVAPDSGTTNAAAIELEGPLPGVSATLYDELDGYTEVQFAFLLGSFTAANGDVYGVTVTNAMGVVLLAVTRPALYDDVETCGSMSQQAQMDLYPSSGSGIECGNGVCNAGVQVTGSFDTTDDTTPVEIALCRNSTVCAAGSTTLPGLAAPNGTASAGLDGDFLGNVSLKESGTTVTYTVQSIEDTAALRDGDVYALTIAQGTNMLVDGYAVATYTATFPNGAQCDPVACHQATLVIH